MSAVVTEIRTRRPDAATPQPVQKEHIELRIGGMTCAHCPPAIEKAAAAVPGVISASVNSSTKIARIDYDSARTKIADILRAIRSVGYTVGTATMRVPIKNMHCGSCLMRIELALQMVPGVVAARASLETNAADIEYQPEKFDFPAIKKAIESAGYHLAEPKIEPTAEVLDPAEAANEQEYRTLMRKFRFAAAVSLPVIAASWMRVPGGPSTIGRALKGRSRAGLRPVWHRSGALPRPLPRGLPPLGIVGKSLILLERAKGLEPSTPTLARSCSTTELHPHPKLPPATKRGQRQTYAKCASRMQQPGDGL
jgi:copper ion binding protein